MDDRPTAPAPASPLFEVAWLRLFPWLRLVRAPGAATDPKRLMIAALGLVAMNAGWWALDRAFGAPTAPVARVLDAWSDSPRRLIEPVERLSAPFLGLFQTPVEPGSMLQAALATLWVVVVWGLCGGAIARIAAVQQAKGERIGVVAAGIFVGKKASTLIGSPLIPLLGVAVIAAPMAGFGLLYRLPSAGPLLAGVLWFLPLIGGLVLTLILLGLAVGWPLMIASAAVEGEDGFDALSRSYAYVYQRPWHYAGYALLAALVGSIGLLFVNAFARAVIHLTIWALSLSGSGETATRFSLGGVEGAATASAIHAFWLGVVGLIARGWLDSFFWTTATTIYLLLRRDVDGTPLGTIAYEGRPTMLVEAASGRVGPVEGVEV